MDFYESLFIYCGYAFNEQQKSAISHFRGPALTLAVPGSGKTTLLLARTVCLVKEWGVPPSKILTMTFSKAAAKDMEQRYRERFMPHFGYKLNFGTIHSFCYRILKTYRQKRGLPIRLIDGDGPSKYEILSQLYRQVRQEYLGEEAYEELSNALSYAKNMMLRPDEFAKSGIKFPQADQLYIAYEKGKQKHGLIDFDDMLSETLAALQDDHQLLASVREAYPFIQVDETQDTSRLQHELIKLIAFPKNNLFTVADDDQSIYGFRGAFPDMILNFDQVYKGAARYYLSQNYRSKDEILKVADSSIRNNQKRYKKSLTGVHGEGGSAELLYFDSLDERNDYLEKLIIDTTAEETQFALTHTTEAETKKALHSPKDIGILYRNHMSALSVIDRLMSLEVPFTLKDGKQKISDKWLVKDVQAFWNLANDLSHLESFEKICYRTSARISKKMVDFVKANHRGRSVIEVMLEAPDMNPYKIRSIRTLESHLTQLLRVDAQTALNIIEKDIGYSQFMTYATEQMGFSEISLNNLWASLKTIGKNHSSLETLFSRLKALDGYMNAHEDSAVVKLSTIHSSKGQEFDTVILLDVNQGLLPSVKEVKSETDLRALEEDRRLFYVGLTRAKSKVFILHCKFQNGDYISPSPFLKEIDSALSVKALKSTVGTSSEPVLNHDIDTGDKIEHKLFGEGRVLEINGDFITIGFEDKIRTLSLGLCLTKGLLCKV